MADDLVFPNNDALSLIEDLGSNMMGEEVLANDINPSFPQSELVNIPEIIPPIISPKDMQKTFHPNNDHTDQTYTPISQLMKQTEELAATLDRPLGSNVNEQVNFNHLPPNSNLQEPIIDTRLQTPVINNSANFANQSVGAMKNSHSLVIQGQRIPIASPTSHTSSIINIKHSSNVNSSMVQTCSPIPTHSNSVVNASSNLKQTMMLKVPPHQGGTKPPMKGQIVKTPDQRLMFVTEVNGKRVGYLIQQPKQANAPQTSQTTQNVLNQHLDKRGAQEASEIGKNSFETGMSIETQKSSTPEAINFTLDENKEIIMRHSDSANKVITEPLIKTDMKSLREKLLNLRNPLNMKNNLKSPLTFPSFNKTVNEKLNSSETFTSEKKLEAHTVSQVIIPAAHADPTLQSVNIVSDIINPQSQNVCHSVTSNSEDDAEPLDNSMDTEVISSDETHTEEESSFYVDEMQAEEDEGQEIEFSENDLTADFEENPIDENFSPGYERGEYEINNDEVESEMKMRTQSTDDEDSVPLALLKNDKNEVPVSPDDHSDEDSPIKLKKKRSKKTKQLKDSPSRAGSSKKGGKDESEKKSKKKKRKVKKSKDPREPSRPIPAFHLFFRDMHHDIKEQHPELNFGEVSKVVSQKWETLEEIQKKKYIDMHETAKTDYNTKMGAFKDLLDQEMVSPQNLPLPESEESFEHVGEKSDVEDKPKKKSKKGRKRKRNKKCPEKSISFKFAQPKEDEDENVEENAGLSSESVIRGVGEEIKEVKKQLRPRKQIKVDDKLDTPPSSPSLPSSDSSSSDEDSESAITRIREKAVELHKYLKEQRNCVIYKKSKQSGKRSRSTKMEVETLSEMSVMGESVEFNESLTESSSKDITVDEEGENDIESESKDSTMEIGLKDDVIESESKDNAMESRSIDSTVDSRLNDDIVESNSKDSVVEEDFDVIKEKPNIDVPVEEEIENEIVPEEQIDDSKNVKIDSDIEKRRNPLRKTVNSKQSISESEDDEVLSNLKVRTQSSRYKKRLEEVEKSESDDESSKSWKRKKRRLKNEVMKAPVSDSEEESKKVSKDEVERLPKSESDEDSSSLKELSQKLKDESIQTKKQVPKEVSTNIPPQKIEEAKPESPEKERSILKNTFRIPKKSNKENGVLPIHGPRICVRHSCENPAKISRERGGQYCSNECLVLYCREVFESWVLDRQSDDKTKT